MLNIGLSILVLSCLRKQQLKNLTDMKKLFAILALVLFVGGFTATAVAAVTATPAVEIMAEEEKKSETKKAEKSSDCGSSEAKADAKKSDCSTPCEKKCEGEKKSSDEKKKTNE